MSHVYWWGYSLVAMIKSVLHLSQSGNCFTIPAEISDPSRSFVFLRGFQIWLAFSLCTHQVYVLLQKCWLFEIKLSHPYVPHGIQIVFLPTPFLRHQHRQTETRPFSWCMNKLFKFGMFPQSFSVKTFSNCRSHSNAGGVRANVFFRCNTTSWISSHDIGRRDRGRRVQIVGHFDFDDPNSFDASGHLIENLDVCNVWRGGSLLDEHSIRVWVIFHNVVT